MKKRRWIVVIALLLGFTILVLYHSWNLLKANDKIKHYLISTLHPVLGKDFDIKKLDVSLGAIHLKDIDLSSREGYYHLHIDDVRFGFNLISLIKSGFRIEKLPQDVIFVRPHLTIQAIRETESFDTSMDSLPSFDANKYLKKMEGLSSIKRITISKGEISYIDSTNKEIRLGNEINGWLSMKDIDQANVRLVGKIFNSENFNMSISGLMNLNLGRLDQLILTLKDYKWNKDDTFFLPEYYHVTQGIINGAITLSERVGDVRGFDIDGNISITDGNISVLNKNLYFEHINVDAELRDWNLYLNNATTTFNGSEFELSGQINNILNPQLYLDLTSSSFDTENFVRNFAPKSNLKIFGSSNILFKIRNTFDRPNIDGLLTSQEIAFNNLKFLNTTAKLTYADSLLHVSSLNMQLDGMSLNATARLNFKRLFQKIKFNITAKGHLFESIIKTPFVELKNSQSNFSFQGEGNFNSIAGAVQGSVRNFQFPDTTFVFNGGLNYRNKKVQLRLDSPANFFNGSVEFNFSKKTKTHFVQLTGLHNLIQDFSEYQKVRNYFHFKHSRVNLELQEKKLTISSELDWNGNTELIRTANLNCVVKSDEDTKRFSGEMKINSGGEQFKGSFDISKNRDFLQIKKFIIEDVLLGEGQISFGLDDSIQVKIVFPNTPASQLSQLFFRSDQSIDQGRLYGLVNISGALRQPNFAGEFDGADLIFHQVGIYNGSLSFDLSNKIFDIHKLEIQRNKESILQTQGRYYLEKDSLNFDLHAENIDLNSTLTALFNKSGLLSGSGTADLRLHGTRKNPCFCGEISIIQGKLSKFSFDKMALQLDDKKNAQDSATPEKEIDYPGLKIKQISIVRNGEFNIQGKGFIPFSNDASLDVDVQGTGNIFAILPELTNFFRETKSIGNWNFRLNGPPSNIVISVAKIDLTGGYLRLGDVAPEIKNIDLSAELEQDGFLNVKYISGKIKRSSFTFRNQREVPNSFTNKLVPFTIPDLGLNLGIFTLETSSKGISLHIPGLMAKRDFGNFVFLGKNNSEKFYLAGPFDRPFVRGALVLHNVDFTFPFITGNKSEADRKDDPVVQVLKSIDWNVAALTGKDIHYQRQVPSGLDNVYVDLIIDNGVGGLQFNGVLAENSFGVTGTMESSRGNVEYLNLNFQVLKAGAEFDMETQTGSEVDFDKSTLLPIIYGEARTTVTDSTGFPYYIYLTLLTIDKETGQAQKYGRLGDVMFQLSSENSGLGDTEGEILASLGYSTSNIKGMATDLIGISADNLVFRPLFRPFERELEQRLGLDIVRFSSRFTRNLIEMNVSEDRNFMIESKLFLLRSTKVMVGKYLANQIFLMYSGQLEAGMDYRYQHEGFGLSHKFGLEYRISSSLLLQMEYDYNSLLLWRREDKKILLRHSFPF